MEWDMTERLTHTQVQQSRAPTLTASGDHNATLTFPVFYFRFPRNRPRDKDIRPAIHLEDVARRPQARCGEVRQGRAAS